MDAIEEILNQLFAFIKNSPWKEWFLFMRDVAIGLNIMFLILTIYAYIQGWKTRPQFIPLRKLKKRPLTLKNEAMKAQWEKIVAKAEVASPSVLSMTIIEADSFVDDALKRMGLKGEHMADRIEQLASEDIRTLDRLWEAHRIRNDIVHTPGFSLSAETARRVLKNYEEFLREVGVI